MNNAPRGCAARREEVYAVHTPREQRAGKRLFVFSHIDSISLVSYNRDKAHENVNQAANVLIFTKLI